MTTYTAQQVLSASAQGLDLGGAAILDSSSNVLADLDSLEPLAAAGKIGSISFTDATAPAFSIPGAQAASDEQVLSLFQGRYTLAVSGATVAQTEQLAAAVPHASIDVFDVPSVISANLDALQAIASHLSRIDLPSTNPYQTETSLTLTQAQLAKDPAAIALLMADPQDGAGSQSVSLSIAGTFTMTQAVAAETLNGYIKGLTVVDSLANLEAALNSMPTRPEVYEAYDPSPVPSSFNFASITLTDSGTPTIVIPVAYYSAAGFLSAIANQHNVDWTGVPVEQVSSLLDNPLGTTSAKTGTLAGVEVSIQDTALHVAGAIDYLEAYALKSEIQSIAITDGTIPTFTAAQSTVDATAIAKITVSDLTAAAAAADAGQLSALAGVTVRDSAANVSASLDGLQSIAAAGKLESVALTDSSTPSIVLSAIQMTTDASALAAIQGTYQLDVTPVTGVGIKGISGAATTVDIVGNAADFTFTAAGNGKDLTVTGDGGTYQTSSIQAVQFADHQVIVAPTPGPANAVTGGNVTELYGAVFGREPDVGGLAFYQAYLAKNPSAPLTQFAQFFLASPEYVNNPEHNYAQTTQGDAQFITDSYQNLLSRTPSTSEVTFYQNVISPFIQGLTPGTAAYATAETQAHALVLTYFSQSPEFLGDVQVTAANTASAAHWLVLI